MATNTNEANDPAESEAFQASVPAPEDTSSDTPSETAVETTADNNENNVVELTLIEDPAEDPVENSVEDPESVVAEVLDPEADAEESETALLTSYADYGFTLKLDLGAEVQAAGWTEPEPSLAQGIMAFTYGGVNANIVWGPHQDRTPLTFLADTYNVLKASQPAVTFESISDGNISVNDQTGVYGGFKAVDASGSSIGGGLIGTWICGDAETAFRMTLTGEDATIVQLRFDRLLENFACSTS